MADSGGNSGEKGASNQDAMTPGQVPGVLYFPPSLISPLPLHEHHLLRLPLLLTMFF